MRTASLVVILVLVAFAAAAVDEAALMRELDIYANVKQDIFCWKRSYGRGVGLIPTGCWDRENQDGLCYVRCDGGFKGVGPVCWQTCPSDWQDHPASCFKHIFNWYFKKSYGRGVGIFPTGCDGGRENQDGLCYPKCSDGFYGVGPVCWKRCSGAAPVDCGAACGSSSKVCVEKIFNMVQTVLEVVKNVAELVITLGGSAATKTATGALKAGFKVAKNFIKKGLSKAAFKKFMKSQGKKLGQVVVESTLDQLYEGAIKAEDLALDIAAGMDPTGIIAVVQSFIHEIC
jgi:hypothetical protein